MLLRTEVWLLTVLRWCLRFGLFCVKEVLSYVVVLYIETPFVLLTTFGGLVRLSQQAPNVETPSIQRPGTSCSKHH